MSKRTIKTDLEEAGFTRGCFSMRAGWLRQRHPRAGQQAVVCTGPHLVASQLLLLETVQGSECLKSMKASEQTSPVRLDSMQCCPDRMLPSVECHEPRCAVLVLYSGNDEVLIEMMLIKPPSKQN